MMIELILLIVNDSLFGELCFWLTLAFFGFSMNNGCKMLVATTESNTACLGSLGVDEESIRPGHFVFPLVL